MNKFTLILFTFFGMLTGIQAQIVVDNTVDHFDAIQLLLGEGVSVSNETFSPGDANQIGSFDCVDCNLGMPEGIILASGDVIVAEGPNDSGGDTQGGGNFGQTDGDLEDLIPGFTINDAAVLEFDFIATGDSVKFNYVWSSEEYNEWVNSSFNDVFGFFLSGPGIDGPYSNNAINIATIPGTDLPVTIDNVNTGANPEYYVNNDNTGSDVTQIQMDGFTVVLTAEAGDLQCGETYHIKIAISDAGDTALDSAIFLEAGSFSSNSVAIETGANNPPQLGLDDDEVLEGCSDGFFTIYRPENIEEDTVQIALTGTAENGMDYEFLESEVIFPVGEFTVDILLIPFYDLDVEGDETVTVDYQYVDGCGDTVLVSATMIIKDYIGMTLEVEDAFVCPGTTEVISGLPDDGQSPFTYNWSSGGTAVNESFGEGSAGDYLLVVTDFCDSTMSTEFVVVEPDPFMVVTPEDFYCLGETTGQMPFGGVEPYIYDFPGDSLEMNQAEQFTTDLAGSWDITATDGCGEVVEFELVFISCFTVIPNVFTPNNDGKNDAFQIYGIAGYPGSELLVYNRWGNLIYSNKNYNNTWTGDGQTDGTYYYIFNRSDGVKFSGYVSLLTK